MGANGSGGNKPRGRKGLNQRARTAKTAQSGSTSFNKSIDLLKDDQERGNIALGA